MLSFMFTAKRSCRSIYLPSKNLKYVQLMSMVIKTKKFQLETNTYIKAAMRNVSLLWWWAWPIPLVFFGIFTAFGLWGWGLSTAVLLWVLYALFWAVQFVGVTQNAQSKILFDKYTYEINNRQILMKINAKQAMPITWDKIEHAYKRKDHFELYLNFAQVIYLPFDIFKNEHDLKVMENILKRKKLLESRLFKLNLPKRVKAEEREQQKQAQQPSRRARRSR